MLTANLPIRQISREILMNIRYFHGLRPLVNRQTLVGLLGALSLLVLTIGHAEAQESAMVRLLKSGRIPEERQGTLIGLIGKQGNPEDLAFLFDQAISPDVFSPANRVLALEALVQAASTRNIQPEGALDRLTELIDASESPDDAVLLRSALSLVGLWNVEQAASSLEELVKDEDRPIEIRKEALNAIASLGGESALESIQELLNVDQPTEIRILAAAALTKLDLRAGAKQAIGVLAEVDDVREVAPLIDAFLGREEGPSALAAIINEQSLETDAAKLGLRYMYSVGRTDADLVAALSKAAGINAEPEPLTDAEIMEMIDEVRASGDPAQGEVIFRRADLNCFKCHALAKAGGNVGPDLSAIGGSSPPDYLIRSILYPAESVKEEYQMKTVLTFDGLVVQGIIAEENDDRIVLRQADGPDRVIPIEDIDAEKTGGSLMPAGLTTFMTRSEFVDLIAFLSELGKPGPYAIRPVPTIQRYRFLSLEPVEGTEGMDPNDASGVHLPATIAAARSVAWQPIYAKVGGSLPLNEVVDQANSTQFALRGEVNVTEAGSIQFSLDSLEGIRTWLDGRLVDLTEKSFEAELDTGVHQLILQVDTTDRTLDSLAVTVTRPVGSTAQFTVVGGP